MYKYNMHHCTKHFLENEGGDTTLTFLFDSQLQLPPRTQPPPQTYKECNAHRDQQSQFVTEVSHQQLAWRKGATWQPTRALGRYGFPSDLKIYSSHHLPAGDPNLVKGYSASHKTDTTIHMFAPNKVFWYHYRQCSETFLIPIVSQKMGSCEQEN